MTSARDAILGKLRQQLPREVQLPDLTDEWTEYADPLAQFSSVLELVGGRCIAVESLSDVAQAIAAEPLWANAKVRTSLIPGVGDSTLDLGSIADPHDLQDVDFALLPGYLAVAENAAVWVDDATLKHRVLYFITQHLALVVPRSELVHNMHQAYERIEVTRRPFGAFISGPSKTADIEQSLVIGAHGARSLTVFLVNDWAGLS